MDVPQIDAEAEDAEFAEGWGGNKRRKLWKASCTRAALNVHSQSIYQAELTNSYVTRLSFPTQIAHFMLHLHRLPPLL